MNETFAWIAGFVIVLLIAWEMIYGFAFREKLEQQAFQQLEAIYRSVGNGVAIKELNVSICAYTYHGGFIWRQRLRHEAVLSPHNARQFLKETRRSNLRWLYWSANPIGVVFALIHSQIQMHQIRKQCEINSQRAPLPFVQEVKVAEDRSLWGQQIG